VPATSSIFRLPLWYAAALALSSCNPEDAQRETKLKWREDDLNAKELNLTQREKDMGLEKQRVESLRLDLVAKQKSMDLRDEQLRTEIEKTRRVRQEIELKELRGPIPSIQAERVVILDPSTGEILWQKKPDERCTIASTTKLLTALLVVEAGNLDQTFVIEASDTQCAPVRLGIKAGETYSRRQLLTAMLVKSSNDIAQALARNHSGSVAAFVEKMNARSAELGLQASRFINPHGLPPESGEEPYATAADLAKIAIACDRQPELRQMMKTKNFRFQWPNGKVTELANTNRLLTKTSACDGMKTGFTEAAGYCLVASAERNGRRRLLIILGSTERGIWKDSESLMEWALKA
jgi:serine-type D-Ala-D-Ala carboxypeptidase (penicillin-binding protein 5/6)